MLACLVFNKQDEWSHIIVLFSVLGIGHLKTICTTVLVNLTSQGTLFQLEVDLTVKKCFLISRRPCFCCTLRAPVVALVALGPASALWNHSSTPISVLPCMTLWTSAMSALCLLSSRLVRPSSFNLSSYVSLFSPEIIFTALFWTFSSRSLSFWHQGDHVWTENSRWGLMYVLYRPKLGWKIIYFSVCLTHVVDTFGWHIWLTFCWSIRACYSSWKATLHICYSSASYLFQSTDPKRPPYRNVTHPQKLMEGANRFHSYFFFSLLTQVRSR